MTIRDTPAFPTPDSSRDNVTGHMIAHQTWPGMTKHQFVATQAMAAILSDLPNTHSRDPGWVAKTANDYADAMIKSWEDPKESK